MLQFWNKPAIGGGALAALLAAAFAAQPVHANVAKGSDAWGRGDYATAVREWEGPAAAGDPEAMLRLALAYWLGRGVPADIHRAEALCARSAAMGHPQAADTYGLLLFELGRREAAMPYLRGAARRGDPRAQYLLGVAHFNGDFIEVDRPRGYALLTLANAAGLPQAASALAEMDRSLPLAQRHQAVDLAERLRAGLEDAWNPNAPTDEPAPAAPLAIETAAAQPSQAVASRGRWKVQLGAFAIPSNADALWSRVESRVELAGAQHLSVPAGRLTLLQAGGFASREAAGVACTALKRSGVDCLVTDR